MFQGFENPAVGVVALGLVIFCFLVCVKLLWSEIHANA